jgi:hypothetical protein
VTARGLSWAKKSGLTRRGLLAYSAAPRRGTWVARGAGRRGDSSRLYRWRRFGKAYFGQPDPTPRSPTNHVDGSHPPNRVVLTPQRLALARRPPIRYDTLPDARQPLPPPKRTAARPPARKRYCVQSLPERCQRPLPPWDVCFSGSFFCAPSAAALPASARLARIRGPERCLTQRRRGRGDEIANCVMQNANGRLRDGN